MLRSSGFFLILAAVTACQEPAPSVTQVAPGLLQVATAAGVSLEVIDWGGNGQPLVFLGGAGATAHFFDDFVPLLSNDLRVLGVTRRGLGASSDMPPKNLDDLVDDIVTVLDALEVGSVILVGHSFAGFEMVKFGMDHADRCSGLVYLDAAYDYNDPTLFRIYEETPDPSAPPMNAADSASVESVQAWYERTQGYAPSKSEIRARAQFDANGRFLGRTPPTATARKFMSMEKPSPDWGAVSCPSLGLYGIPGPLEEWLPYYQQLDSLERQRADEWQRAYSQWASEQMTTFEEVPQNTAVEYNNGAHIFFLRQPEEVAKEIREFVSRLQ